jgi:hypothetical protein
MKTIKQHLRDRELGPDPYKAAETLAEDIRASRLPYSKIAAEVRGLNQVWITCGDDVPLRIDAVVVGGPGEICWLIDGAYVISHEKALDLVIEVLLPRAKAADAT